MEQAGPLEQGGGAEVSGGSPAIERRGLEFLADFYGTEVARKPENVDVLTELGHVLTRLGRYGEGLEVDRELARREPEDPNVLYNLACSLALTGAHDEAIRTLDRAILHGYEDAEHLAADDDLASLRDDARFDEMLRVLRRESA